MCVYMNIYCDPGLPKGVKKICTTVLAVQHIYVKVLCLVIVNVNVTKYMPQKCQKMTDLWLSGVFFQALNTPKTPFRPDHAGGAYNAPPDPIVSWGGVSPPHTIPPQRLWHLDLGASVVRPPQHKFLAMPMLRKCVTTHKTRWFMFNSL